MGEESVPGGSAPEARIGPYRVLGEIGRGGMGIVYKAHHPDLNRTVALKVLIAGEDASEEAVERFRREAESAARLGHHPHIVPVYDIGSEGNRHWIAMHFVEGRPLDALIDTDELAPKRAVDIAKKIAGALHHAHENGILHRDVKPSNILVTTDGEPQLTDFGLARDVRSDSRMTASGVALGTPAYMSPEQARGRLDEVDARSDVYCLGATLYEILTLQPPFEGATAVEVLQKVLLKEPLPPRRLNRALDRDLETICLKCLEKDQKNRYPTAKALASDLDRYSKGRPITARPVSIHEKFLRHVHRNKVAWSIASVAALILAAGAVAGVLAFSSLEAEKRESQETDADRAMAESRAKTEEDLLKESQSVSEVLRSAHRKLGPALRDFKSVFYSPAPPAKVAEVAESHRDELEAFEKALPSDSASRAAWLAARGWMTAFARRPDDSASFFRQARESNPDVIYGWLFEAMVYLIDYFRLQRWPKVITATQVEGFTEFPKETDEMARLRGAFLRILGEMEGKRVWGRSAEKEFRAFANGLESLMKGDLEEADSGFSAALSLPEAAWMEEEILMVRSRVRCMTGNLEGALADTASVVEKLPNCPAGQYSIGYIRYMCALKISAEGGGDPFPVLEDAVLHLTQAIESEGAGEVGALRIMRGMILTRKAEIELDIHRDASASIEKAMADFRAAVESDRGDLCARVHLGNAFALRGTARKSAGIDPDSDFREALGLYDAVLLAAPDDVIAVSSRGHVYRQLAELELVRGNDPYDWLRKSRADIDRALRLDPDFSPALLHRAALNREDAFLLARQGRDPREMVQKAKVDLDAVLKKEPRNLSALHILAEIHAEEADFERLAGRDPRPVIESGLACCDRLLRFEPRFTQVLHAKANLLVTHGNFLAERGMDPRRHLNAAIESSCKALAEQPDMHTALGIRSRALAAKARYEMSHRMDPGEGLKRALDDVNRAIGLLPGNLPLLAHRGTVYVDLATHAFTNRRDGREALRSAIADFDKVLEDGVGDVGALNNRGIAYFNLAKFEGAAGADSGPAYKKAIADFREVIRRDPAVWGAWANMGQALERLCRTEEAVQAFERGFRETGGSNSTLQKYIARSKMALAWKGWRRDLLIGGVLVMEGDYRAARALLEPALKTAGEQGPSENPVLTQLAYFGEFSLARIYSLASTGKSGPIAETVPIEPGEARELQKKALEHLDASFRLGMRAFGALEQDPDLEPVRRLPEYRAMIEKWKR